MKRLIGRSDIKDALQKLDNLMQEESLTVAAQGLKATQGVDERVVGIGNDVQGVGDRVNDVDDRVRGVGDRIDVVIDGGERLRGELQRVASDVGDQKRSCFYNYPHCWNMRLKRRCRETTAAGP